jgi:hypothetical protein
VYCPLQILFDYVKAETRAYNEREKTYDALSNLFSTFQAINKSDIDGSKTAKFWKTDLLPFVSSKVCRIM